jgi:hypothetical protein
MNAMNSSIPTVLPATSTPSLLSRQATSGNESPIKYSPQLLQQIAQFMTSQGLQGSAQGSKPPAAAGQPQGITCPVARNLVASWFSLLSAPEQATALAGLQQLAPSLNAAALASQGVISPGSIPGSNPSSLALDQANLIPVESLDTALNTLIGAMDPSLYDQAGSLALNHQMAYNLAIDGMPLLNYVTEEAKQAMQEGS